MIILKETKDYAGLRHYVLQGSDIIYQIYNDDEVVGVMGIVSNDIVYVDLIEIDVPYRGRGYAPEAMKALREMYKGKDIHGFAIAESTGFWRTLDVAFVDLDDITGNVAFGMSSPFVWKYK